MDKISIIVPVYNVENYLSQCISSLLNQTYKNIEVILVDDGSSDSCGILCDKAKVSDSRVNVIHKTNGGLSDAKNAGLDAATGQYIGFVDSDDYIHPRMYEFLYQALIEHNADIAQCKEYAFPDGESVPFSLAEQYTVSSLEDTKHSIYRFMYNFSGPSGWAWNKLYKREVIGSYRFPKGSVIEGLYFNSDVIPCAQKMVFLSDQLYYYRQRTSSTMGTKKERNYTDFAESQIHSFESLSKFGDDEFKRKYSYYSLNKLGYLLVFCHYHKMDNAEQAIREMFLSFYRIRKHYGKIPKEEAKLFLIRFCFPLYYQLKKKYV